jgi:hypothetical protein
MASPKTGLVTSRTGYRTVAAATPSSYWQARKIERVVCECNPEGAGIDRTLLEHVSPIEWDNVLLYGQYVIDPSLIRTS